MFSRPQRHDERLLHTELVGIREAIPSSNFAQVAAVTALCTRLDALTTTLASVEVYCGWGCVCVWEHSTSRVPTVLINTASPSTGSSGASQA